VHITVGALEEWLKKLGTSDKRVVLVKPTKRSALVFSSMVCRNIRIGGGKVSVYDDYLRVSAYLSSCGCDYREINDGCLATIRIVRSLPPKRVCRNNRLIVTGVSSGWYGREDFYIVRLDQTGKPGRYVLEVNSVKYLVELGMCTLRPARLSVEEEMILNELQKEMESRGHLTFEELLLIISKLYNVNKSKARIKLNEIITQGLAVPSSRNTIEIPLRG